MQMRAAVAALILVSACQVWAQQADSSAPPAARLAGIVRDSAGAPLRDAEVSIPELRLSTTTGSDGAFQLAVARGGQLNVWVRSFGYAPATFDWMAVPDQRVEIAVTLRPRPVRLDTVVVNAREATRMAGSSEIRGVVVDDRGNPVPDAEVQLLGAARRTYSNEDGEFRFRRVGEGTYQLRVRQLGYSPATVALQVARAEERDLAVKLVALATTLKAVEVTARSGFGKDAEAYEDFERRQLWRGTNSVYLGPTDLQKFGRMGLDRVAQQAGNSAFVQLGLLRETRADQFKMSGEKRVPIVGKGPILEGDQCVLENGVLARMVPLRVYSADQIESLEIYGPASDVTGSIGRQLSVHPPCGNEGFVHPIYFVVWLKKRR